MRRAAPVYKEGEPIVVIGARLRPSRPKPRPRQNLESDRKGWEPREPEHERDHRKAERGLDWPIFFVADIQTGFGPFVTVFLTEQKWTQVDIGLLLSTGTLVGLFGQIPAGPSWIPRARRASWPGSASR